MRFLIVTGLSGAGKTSVLRHLEDNGYQCMDNLPPLLLSQAFTLCEKVELDRPVALGVDSRSGALFNAEAVLEAIDSGIDSHDVSILFLDADAETLIDRYKETRRDHPLMKRGKTLEECIARERELLQPLRERANYVLSTTGMQAKETCAAVDALLAQEQSQHLLRTEIMSFGYKRGIPVHRSRSARARLCAGQGGNPCVPRPSVRDGRLSDPVVSARGQAPPDDRHRLHRRRTPLRRHQRGAVRASARAGTDSQRHPPGHRARGGRLALPPRPQPGGLTVNRINTANSAHADSIFQ